jgi:hypothetical protein
MRPNENIEVESVYLTPMDAAVLLEQNINNRPKRTKLVEKYANLMVETLRLRAEQDFETPSPWRTDLPIRVTLDANGHIQNSQHCLSALVKCEQVRALNPSVLGDEPLEITAIIERGVQPVDADMLDIGANRTHADVLFRKDLFSDPDLAKIEFTDSDMKKMSKTLGTAAKIIWLRLEHGKKLRASVPFDHATMTRIVEYNPGLIESVAFVHALDKEIDKASGKAGGVRSVINPAYVAAAHYLSWHSQQREDGSGMKRTMADGFFRAFGTGQQSKQFEDGCPALACRTYLSRLPAKKDNDVLEGMFDAMILAWNATKDPKNHPLVPKTPFKVNKKTHPDGMVWMGGIDAPPPPKPEDQLTVTPPEPETEVDEPEAEPEAEAVEQDDAAVLMGNLNAAVKGRRKAPPVPPTRPEPPKLSAAQKADAAALRASGKAPPKPVRR